MNESVSPHEISLLMSPRFLPAKCRECKCVPFADFKMFISLHCGVKSSKCS